MPEVAKRVRFAALLAVVLLALGMFFAPLAYAGQNQKRAAAAAPKVYSAICQAQCRHKPTTYCQRRGATTLSGVQRYQITSCNVSASLVMQAAGCLPYGYICGHTPSAKGKVPKNTVRAKDQCMIGWRNLRRCKIYAVNKKFPKMSSKYKKAGYMYIYDSNAAIYAGGNRIYSTNGTGMTKGRYCKLSKLKKKDGYCFTAKILYVIAPK